MNIRQVFISLSVGAAVMLSACQPVQPIEPAADSEMEVEVEMEMEMASSNTAEEEANLAVVDGFFVGLVDNKDAEETGSYLSDDFISNAPSVAGKEGMMSFATWQAENQPDAAIVDEFHTLAIDDLVVKYYTYASDPAVGADLTIVDFFRVADGLIVEYWDVVTPMGDPDPNAGITAATDEAADEAANLAVVDGFFEALVENKDADAVATFLTDDFISHTPTVDGKEGMVGFAGWQAENSPNAGFVDVIHTLAKGDLVVKYYTYGNEPTEGAELTIVDFFRVTDGKIVEYWDIVAAIEAEE